ncbi:hypothetical protein TNCT_552001 [Trichonephila clavata]|uniref:Uncharacterized protein n=1 Tax=Trichonephila clavata TaxID=2740835 RepID=A0A8X6F4F6_TRICU|nr:hypothetical protein TNCT_552001 [Trichonephila clavata]
MNPKISKKSKNRRGCGQERQAWTSISNTPRISTDPDEKREKSVSPVVPGFKPPTRQRWPYARDDATRQPLLYNWFYTLLHNVGVS